MRLHEPASLTSFWAATAAVLVLAGLAVGGGLIVGNVRMVPSAVPPEMAVGTSSAKRSLASNTHAQLQLSSSGPAWKELTTAQRAALAPLESRWSSMGEAQKRRWLAMAENFEQLSAQEQHKLSSRMAAWASLSVQQRNQARLNFSTRQQYSPGELQAKWDAYQALSEADAQGISGKAVTPYLLARIKDLSGGASLATNIALVKHNASVGAALARTLKG